MLNSDDWKADANDAITAARRAKTITLADANRLRNSVSEPVDLIQMERDTERRLGGGYDV